MLPAFEILIFALVLGTETSPRITFEEDIRPVFKAYCFDCHGASEKPKGGLDLRLKKFAQKGGKSGSSLKENAPEQSHLFQRMKSGEMPPSEKKVPAEKIALIERWIKTGAQTLRPEPDSLPPGIGITEEERNYWFFKPLVEPKVPDIALNQKKLAPLDAFILTKLQQKNLGFNPEADKRTLIRRAYLDLTGLPPTIDQVERFEKNTTQNAYETLIDELLASPAYGERWARHWLDVAGYADTEGDSPNDSLRPHLYKYRDYVIRALNSDKPFNQFIIEQLAGDELAPKPWDELSLQARELLAATGFLRCGPDITAGGGAIAEAEQTFTESIKIISSGLLGLSVGCAQCHDHRYDPISQVDYFRFRAIFEPAFNPSQWRKPAERTAALMAKPDREKSAQIEKAAQELASKLQAETSSTIKVIFDKELQKIPAELHETVRKAFETPDAKRTPEQKKLFEKYPKINVRADIIDQYDPKAMAELKKAQAIINAKRAEKPKEDFYAIMSEVPNKIPATKLFHRGDYRQPLQEIIPGDLSIATVHEPKTWDCPTNNKGESSGRRLAFAQHLTSGNHPQFNRTMANRIWVYHFGQGIVETPGEFGKLGTLPSQPELLDWLALQLPKNNWSLKAFHKLIMNSATYRQSSIHRPEQDSVDITNQLYGRFPLRRLEAESIRDSILKVNNRLDPALYGAAIPLKEDLAGVMHYPDESPRKTIYMQVRRHKPSAFLLTFDGPGLSPNCDKRTPSAGTPQALALMNSEFIRNESNHLATLILKNQPNDTNALIIQAWKIVYQRPPNTNEILLVSNFLAESKATYTATKNKDPNQMAWTDLCQQLLASNEFIYLE
jgi:hypothetical protein